MKLRIMGFEEIDFNDQDNTILIIKNHKFYAHILSLLSSILYDKNKSTELLFIDGEKNITTNVLLITDLLITHNQQVDPIIEIIFTHKSQEN